MPSDAAGSFHARLVVRNMTIESKLLSRTTKFALSSHNTTPPDIGGIIGIHKALAHFTNKKVEPTVSVRAGDVSDLTRQMDAEDEIELDDT